MANDMRQMRIEAAMREAHDLRRRARELVAQGANTSNDIGAMFDRLREACDLEQTARGLDSSVRELLLEA